jgi:PAS domain S-box-containing protein
MAAVGQRKRTAVERAAWRQAGRALEMALLTIGTTVLLYLTRGPEGAFFRPILHFLYLLPIALMAYSFGLGWGMALALLCASLFMPVLGQDLATRGMSAEAMEMVVAIILYIALAYFVGSLAGARRRQERLQETLNLLGAILDESLSLPALLPVILSRSADLLQAERGEIFLRDEASGRPVPVAQVGLPGATEPAPRPAGPDKSLPEWLLEQGRPFLSNDLAGDPRFYRPPGNEDYSTTNNIRGALPRSLSEAPYQEAAGEAVPRAVIAAPLRRGPETFGLLALQNPLGRFQPEDLELLEAVAEKCGIAIENARLYGELRAFSQELEERVRQRTAQLVREFQQREAILHSIADGVVVAGRQGELVLFNPVAAEVLPCLREKDVGRPILELASALGPGDSRREVLQRMGELLDAPAGQGLPAAARALRFTAGPQSWVALFAPVVGQPGQIEGIVAILHDITQEIEALNSRTQFVSSVAHDLRVPLTSVRGYSDLLLMQTSGPLTEEQRLHVEAIQRNAERMAALVRDLLDLCRLESGRVQIEPAPTSLPNAVEEVTTLMRPQLAEKQMALEVHLPPGLPLVLADPDRLNQVLTNLISNACHYTPTGGKIALTADHLPPPQSDRRHCPERGTAYVEVAVRDTGIGIPAQDLERIFERFVRLDHPLVEQAGGTGLGLTIVRQLLQLQGGRIWVESALGQGSTFYFTLPVAEN